MSKKNVLHFVKLIIFSKNNDNKIKKTQKYFSKISQKNLKKYNIRIYFPPISKD